MKLAQILKGQQHRVSGNIGESDVTDIATHSQKVIPGSVFIALKPLDGNDVLPHILDAIQKGASYIIKDQDVHVPREQGTDQVVFIDVIDTRRALSRIAANLFPRQPEKLVAITGTNGKSSVASFLRQIWEMAGYKAASLGTIGLAASVDTADLEQSGLTTPEPFQLHRTLDALAMRGITHACLEASSHGIHQHRLDCLNLSGAAFTNLTHEHLDYHGTLEEYFNAKCALFSGILPEGAVAVLNADDFRFHALYEICRQRGHEIITFGREARHIQLVDALVTDEGQILSVKINGRNHKIELPLIGLVQGYNVMAALGLAIGCGIHEDTIIPLLSGLKCVPGRFERIGRHPSGGLVYVDYAHKPHALETVLTSLKPHVRGLLSVVFGCGGNRDKEKRLMMGEIAARYADRVIVTDDNPRLEQPESIRREILQGCPDAVEIPNRRDAIVRAISELGSCDVCVIAGKGHEQGQIIGDTVMPFDDREVARQELEKLGGTLF